MSNNNKFLKIILESALFGITFFAGSWVLEKIHDQNKEILEMFLRLEDCEEKLSQLEDCKEKKIMN